MSLTLFSLYVMQEIEAALGAKLTTEDEADIERQLEALAAEQTATDVTARLPDVPVTPIIKAPDTAAAAAAAAAADSAAAAEAAPAPALARRASERHQQLAA